MNNETPVNIQDKAREEIYEVITKMAMDARSPVEIYNSCDSVIRLKYFSLFKTRTIKLPEETTQEQAFEIIREKLYTEGSNRWIAGRKGASTEHNLALFENSAGFNLVLLEFSASMGRDENNEPYDKVVITTYETSVNSDLLMS